MKRNFMKKMFIAGMVLAGSFTAEAGVVEVLNTLDTGPGSLRTCISVANAGDTLIFHSGMNGVPMALSTGEIIINKPLVFMGNGSSATVMSGTNNSRIFTIINAGTVTFMDVKMINGMTLLNGAAINVSNSTVELINSELSGNMAVGNGGAIYNSGTVHLDNCVVANNTAGGAVSGSGGGGIYNDGGSLMIENGSVLMHNMATGLAGSGGAVLSASGAVTITHSMLDSNSATRAGGAIEIGDGSLMIYGCVMSNNDVNGMAGTPNPGNGGAVHVSGVSNTLVTVDSSMVMFNMAASEGGGLWNQSGSTMTVQNNTTLRGNVALGANADNGGGAIFNNGGNLNIANAWLMANMATGTSGSGGAIFSTDGIVMINDCVIDSNAANRAGGAIEIIDGSMDITASTMMYNDVNGMAGTANPGNGGALHVTGNSGTMVTISGGTIAANFAAREGGALWNQSGSVLAIQNQTTIDANVAAGVAADDGGGGIFNNGGVVNISAATISNNSATGTDGTGGGVFNYNNGVMTMTHATVSGNMSNAGGGIHNNGMMNITASTITNNTAATDGGGIAQMNTMDTVMLTSTIVAGNMTTAGTGVDIYSSTATALSGGYNLIGEDDASHFAAISTDIEGSATAAVDAKLDALADNGGGVKTHALQPSSPAIDKGDPMNNSNDQRDEMVYNNKRDIGAFESKYFPQSVNNVQAAAITSVTPNPSMDGVIQVTVPNGTDADVNIMEIGSGKIVYAATVSGSTKLNLSNQPSGTYLVRVSGPQGVETHKLVIAK